MVAPSANALLLSAKDVDASAAKQNVIANAHTTGIINSFIVNSLRSYSPPPAVSPGECGVREERSGRRDNAGWRYRSDRFCREGDRDGPSPPRRRSHRADAKSG